jgi:signal transduction histidine kinase
VSKRPGESLTPIEQKLLDDLAHQAGLVLKNVGLTSELLARLEDLRASRQRLVAAQDQERRKLERNLHDGAQQNLVAIKLKLGLAAMLADKDPERARQSIVELKADTDEALDTLRDLARGIYPPLLADKGLRAALESQARKATLPVIVEADGIGRYSQDIEAAVYFCCLEAMQNVQKYAGAGRATIRLREVDGGLNFEVDDDGAGFDAATQKKGSGLQNMEDRLDALGGALQLRSAPSHGTVVTGRLPLAAESETDQEPTAMAVAT